MLVRTLWSGLSTGSELLAYGDLLGADVPLDETMGSLGGTFRYPFGYGYSCVGRVEDSGGLIAPGTVVFAFHSSLRSG